MGLFGGVVLPDLAGWGGFKVKYSYNVDTFTSTGLQYVRGDTCPWGKAQKITYTSLGFNVGSVSDCLFEVVDELNARVLIAAMFPNLTLGQTENIFATIWITGGQKLSARFNVVTIQPTCWLAYSIEEYDWGG